MRSTRGCGRNDLDTIYRRADAGAARAGQHDAARIDGSGEFTFTAPCGDRLARDGDCIAAVRDLFIGIKLVAATAVADMRAFDPLAVPGTITMVSFTFHSIGGVRLSVSTRAQDALLAHFAAHRDVCWTDTFRHPMRWLRARQAEARTNPVRPDRPFSRGWPASCRPAETEDDEAGRVVVAGVVCAVRGDGDVGGAEAAGRDGG